MRKCNHCNSPFKWSQIFKGNWTYRTVQCTNCHSKHKITFYSRFIIVGLTLVPMVIFGNFLSPFKNVFITILFSLIIFVIGLLLTPFIVKYKNVDNGAKIKT